MVWSNSPAALASIPARVVILDEVDKFNEGGRKEADAVNLAEQRTKTFSNPKRIKTSTPTLSDGLIWQEFAKTDQRRRFMPCPHCGKLVLFAWSKAFTVFPLTGNEAFIKWDSKARRPKDNSWIWIEWNAAPTPSAALWWPHQRRAQNGHGPRWNLETYVAGSPRPPGMAPIEFVRCIG